MLKEYSNFFREASAALERIEDTLVGIQLSDKDDAAQVLAMQALSMSRNHCRAIALLLEADLFGESLSVFRSLFELHFDLLWVQSCNCASERLERVYRLEANPYSKMADEARRIVADANSSTPHTSKEMSDKWKKVVEESVEDYPHLVIKNPDGTSKFKKAPQLDEKMGDLRIQYYHIYRLACLFTHPTPMLKQLYLRQVGNYVTVNEMVGDTLKRTLAHGLLFVEYIARIAIDLLRAHLPQNHNVTDKSLDDLFQLVERANDGYFGTPTHKLRQGGLS